MVREKGSISSPEKFYGIEHVDMLQILVASDKRLGKLQAVLEIKKKILPCGQGLVKVKFKVLYFTNTNISFALPLCYGTIKFLRVRRLS